MKVILAQPRGFCTGVVRAIDIVERAVATRGAGKDAIGLTAGASAPAVLVDDVISVLAQHGPIEIKALQGVEEKINFRLPPELLAAS
jgi:4-hydroxy-3-methylbut-2-enyl diphosphate reductase IspH